MPDLKSTNKVVLRAPAKLNLRLKVLGRRSNGYHELSMLNVPISLHDRLFVKLTHGGDTTVRVYGPFANNLGSAADVPEQNSASRATIEFFNRFNLPYGASIEIEKNVPVGAGLGGGSSDAAAVLRFLAVRFEDACCEDTELSRDDFQLEVDRIAQSIGADVPYLLYGGVAAVGGIGEELSEVSAEFLSSVNAWIVYPGSQISTASVFARLRELDLPGKEHLPQDTQLQEWIAAEFPDEQSQYVALLTLLENDLVPFAHSECSLVPQMLSELDQLVDFKAQLSGSGSSAFILPKSLNTQDKDLPSEFLRWASAKHFYCYPIRLLANLEEYCNFIAPQPGGE